MKKIVSYVLFVSTISQIFAASFAPPVVTMAGTGTDLFKGLYAAAGVVSGFLFGTTIPGSLLTGSINSATSYANVSTPDTTACQGGGNLADLLLYAVGYFLGVPFGLFTPPTFVKTAADTAVLQCRRSGVGAAMNCVKPTST